MADLLENRAAVPVITIDGPSGSGKGTVSHWLAQKLGWHMLDSGALYRIVAFAAETQKISMSNSSALATLAEKLDVEFGCNEKLETVVLFQTKNISLQLRSENCARMASKVAAIPEVREALLARQIAFRKEPGLVADGRDMGTVIFKDAVLKVFLTASAEERAQRRYKQLNDKGISANLADLLKDIKARDERDISRTASPLKPADDACVLDTTTIPVQDVCNSIYTMVREKGFI